MIVSISTTTVCTTGSLAQAIAAAIESDKSTTADDAKNDFTEKYRCRVSLSLVTSRVISPGAHTSEDAASDAARSIILRISTSVS